MSDSDREECPFYITFRAPDRSVIEHVVGLHSASDSEVETISICDPCEQTGSQPVVVDLGSVTKNQWEALEAAHNLGHYSGGKRGGNLDLIADKLDISKSAVSQRLRSAESRIIEGILATGRITCEEELQIPTD